jgi:hypothetical protein
MVAIILIDQVENTVDNDNCWYNLRGQKVEHPKSGLYIHNGKKVWVK